MFIPTGIGCVQEIGSSVFWFPMSVGFHFEVNMDKEKSQIAISVEIPEDNKKQVYLKLIGLDKEIKFDFTTIEDAETASRLGGSILNCFERLFRLGIELDTEEENPSIQLSAN